MPYHKSAIKRMKQDRVAKARNSAARSKMRTAIKKVRKAENKEEAKKALAAAVSIIDKTASKGIIHKNAAARHKSRLARFVKSLETQQAPVK